MRPMRSLGDILDEYEFLDGDERYRLLDIELIIDLPYRDFESIDEGFPRREYLAIIDDVFIEGDSSGEEIIVDIL